jgi:predicted DNA-binding protein (UPF0251 family)
VFKPAGIPSVILDEVVMTLDEFEALRLADLEGLYHEQAAERMRVSRPTFSRIVQSAHLKVAEALVHGKAIRIEGGPVQFWTGRRRCCQPHAAAGDAQPGIPRTPGRPPQERVRAAPGHAPDDAFPEETT